jgi:lipopolysaccharide/colanic/teichoic acid biosynthesis glycosyltransferase
VAKRVFDCVASAIGLLLLAPLMLVVALAIKLESAGPVMFRQERVGRHGKVFRIHKFRTMAHAPSNSGPLITVGGDTRITRVGALLRRAKLDELPQLIDVVAGDMSLVGPRPEVPKYVAMYPPELRDKVLSVRPGITDIASIEYRQEGKLLALARDPEREYVEVVLPKKLSLAVEYVDRQSLLGDVRLILRTVTILIKGA